ncbi:hypothetical protein D1007_26316 [Hordeum vulgare]|nr:hypothetical protein D1007_26316 [Hordeum vulgare]
MENRGQMGQHNRLPPPGKKPVLQDKVIAPPGGNQSKLVASRVSIRGVEIHPFILDNEVHEVFVEETRKSSPLEVMIDHNLMEEGSPARVVMPSASAGSVPLSAHLEYYSNLLSKFEMDESKDEEVEMNPEMQCLSREVISALGSVKRSLFETLEEEAQTKK